MVRSWTDEQKAAIYAPVGKYNILVSADAGSGKTAVLVERICNMIINEGVSIENLLVVTFTNAAAAGMKEKIINRLQQCVAQCNNSVEKRRLKEQTYLCATADILTIDAFCLNVLKNNFHFAGISPNFYIMDKTEEEIIKVKAIENVFDELYTSDIDDDNKKLNKLIFAFADNRSDDKLIKLIMDVYKFSQSFDEPLLWIDNVCKYYDKETNAKVWFNELYLPFVYKKNLAEVIDDLKNAVFNNPQEGEDLGVDVGENAVAKKSVDAYTALALYASDLLCFAQELYDCSNINELMEKNNSFLVKALSSKYTGISRYPNLSTAYDEIATAVKDVHKCILQFPYKSGDELAAEIHLDDLNEIACALSWITKKYDTELAKLKEKRNAWSFSDIEHKVYNLFNDKSNGLCEKYRDKYTEILIDEYQDTNGLQDSIFKSISKNNKNIFMVGDLKQSIYLFRGGDPYIFKKKYNEYSEEVNEDNEQHIKGRLLKLSKNFRCSKEVLKSVDALFSNIMTDEVGDVNYTCNSYDNNEVNNDLVTKLYPIACVKGEYEDEEKICSRAQAQYMAKKAKELVGRTIKVGENEEKVIGYGDITILVRAIKNHASIYMEEFKKAGVPLRVALSDFFDKREVQVMVSLLSVISNFKQDIALMSVLLSPVFAFSANEIAYLKCEYRDKRQNHDKVSLFDIIDFMAKNCDDALIAVKCENVVEKLRRWRKYTRIMTVAKLIWTIYEESGFYDFMGALDGSEESQKNLRLLYQRAQSFESGGSMGLFNFVQYMVSLRENKEEISGAKSVSEDAVSMMTIHASKGLEFPIVFLGGMEQKLKNSLSEGSVKMHGDYGIGIKYNNIDEQIYQTNIYTDTISYVNDREKISEYVRLLYVAMTRAQHILMNFAAFKAKDEEDIDKIMQKWYNTNLNNKTNIKAQCFEDWVVPVALMSDSIDCDDVHIYQDSEELYAEEENNMPSLSDEGKQSVKELLDYKYKFQHSTDIPSRTSATELKKAESIRKKSQITIRKKPGFMSNETDAALRGIAYHNAMAYINLNRLREELELSTVEDELKRLCDEDKINRVIYEQDKEMAQRIYAFFVSELGSELLKNNNVHREKGFQTNIDASYYKKEAQIEKGEKMILQGVIDCFYENDAGEIILLDFKTDNMKNKTKQDMLNMYGLQLDLYTQAIEKITNKRVVKKYLYLFDTNEAAEYN